MISTFYTFPPTRSPVFPSSPVPPCSPVFLTVIRCCYRLTLVRFFISCFLSLNVIKDTNATKQAFGLCDHLANATIAQKIPLSDVYLTVNTTVTANTTVTVNATVTANTTVVSSTKPTDKKPTQGASCVMTSFAFLYFMLFLSSTCVTSNWSVLCVVNYQLIWARSFRLFFCDYFNVTIT